MQAEDMRKAAMEGLVRSSTLNYTRCNLTALEISGESFVASSVEDLKELTEYTHPQPKKMQRKIRTGRN